MLLRIAVQKSGRLNEGSLQLLRECGIRLESSREQLRVQADNFPLEVFYLRNSDIPQYVEDAVADIAIIGENLLAESQKPLIVVQKLGFSRCRLSLAVPRETAYPNEIEWFNGKRLATSYPNTLSKFLKEKNIDAEIHEISGSVEIAPNIGLADGICDLVSSGNTLFMNGLKEVETILKSEACVVARHTLEPERQALLEKLLFRIRAVLAARKTKYVLLNAPDNKLDEICNILPGVKSPTIMPLAEKGWSSVHSVIAEDDFWEMIDQLKAAGAQGILIMPVEKIIM